MPLRSKTSDGRRPHLLLLAMFFPPSRGSGVYRGLALANQFSRQGWDVTVATVTENFFEEITGSTDTSLVDSIDPAVTVRRVPFPSGHMQGDIRRHRWFRANFPKLVSQIDGARLKLFPDKYATWIPPLLADMLKVHARDRVDMVIATGNPWSSFEAARLFRRATGVPYVMDYRDSWTLNQFTEGDMYAPGHAVQRAERRLVREASALTFVNEPMRAWHSEKYPEAATKMHVVENGYDPELVASPPFRAPQPDQPLVLGSVGTVTEVWPHEAAWGGWALASEDDALAGARWDLYGHLGFFPSAVDRIRAMLPAEGQGVEWRGAVPKRELGAVYESFDVLVLAIPSSRYVTAGKVYEAIATGKPIVSIHTPETAATFTLAGYPMWFPVTELTAQDVASQLIAAARRARTMTEADHAAAVAHARQYERARLVKPLSDLLLEKVKR